MGAYLQKFGQSIYPNGETMFTVIQRLKNSDSASCVTIDGFVLPFGALTNYSYTMRGLGFTVFPTPDVFLPVGHVFAARDTTEAGAGDYITPLVFYPYPIAFNGAARNMVLLRGTQVRTTKTFEQYIRDDNGPQFTMLKVVGERSSVFLGEFAHIKASQPLVAPLVAGDLPGGGSLTTFNYDPGMTKLGVDKLISHTFYREMTGVNTLVTSPWTQANMNANITP